MRYSQLNDILNIAKPENILEIGTWNGDRAIQMMACGAKMYYGFDLFEDASPETDEAELNVKPHWSVKNVINKFHGAFEFILYKGNTNETLPGFLEEMGENAIDFAYIDGGHSVETIQSDYEHVKRLVKPDGVIVFDDFYSGMSSDFIDKFGANRILEPLDFMLFPMKDPVKTGGFVQMAIVRNEK